jgi:hypothetical protein
VVGGIRQQRHCSSVSVAHPSTSSRAYGRAGGILGTELHRTSLKEAKWVGQSHDGESEGNENGGTHACRGTRLCC